MKMFCISKSRKAFTLIELLITISIFMVLGTVGLLTFIRNRQSNELKQSTSELASNIRKIQSYTRSGKSITNPVNGLMEVPRAFGISLTSVAGGNTTYFLYADFGDETDDYYYDPAVDAQVENYSLANNTEIAALDIGQRTAYEKVDLVFIVPTSGLIAQGFAQLLNPPDPPVTDLLRATITVNHDQAGTKDLIVEGGVLGGVTIEE